MNQTQRDFLIRQVEKTCESQQKKLRGQIPDKPSLNNYLVACFLDNSIKFADIETLKKKMRKSVIKFGTDDLLVKKESKYSRYDDDEETETVSVDPSDLFIIPENYIEALKEYESKRAEIESKIDSLENTKQTIVLKLQIGSSSVLDKIVMQVDNMGDLNLMNTQLLIENKG